MKLNSFYIIAFAIALVTCCTEPGQVNAVSNAYARYFDIQGGKAVTISPDGSRRDSLDLSAPFARIVCMSSTHVACLSLIDRQDAVVGVSGLDYITDTLVRTNGAVIDVGAVDFERVIALHPDLLVADGTADCSRLESFGIKVIHVYDFMEEHPLARAEYVRLFGAIAGCREKSDSVFAAIRDSYEAKASLSAGCVDRPGVLVNIPYKDAWYVPGKDSYFARLIRDAGADVVGAREGAASAVMTVEKAFTLAGKASFWLHPGWCRTLDELKAAHPLFADFGVFGEGKVFNNILKAGPKGGNDYYESGAVRPDLVLEDLIRIFHPELMPEKKNASPEDLHYYIELH